MSREIKFRAWYKPLGIMVTPDKLEMINFEVKVLGVYLEMDGKGFNKLRMSDFELLQYTGLKDKNDREIYEGDIIDGSYKNPMSGEVVKRQYEVAYERGRYLAKLIGNHPYGTTMLYFENEKSEVVGSIFENPELLEV